MSNFVWPHRRQPTRLPRPWDSPGKNTGVGCHFLLQCIKVKSESEIAQSCPTLCDPMDCSPPGSSIHGICQARVLEWGPSPSPRKIPYPTLTLNSPGNTKDIVESNPRDQITPRPYILVWNTLVQWFSGRGNAITWKHLSMPGDIFNYIREVMSAAVFG